MGKIYRYECRRLLWNQFFVGLIAVLLCYGALVLRDATILGCPTQRRFPPGALGIISAGCCRFCGSGRYFF